MNIRKLVTKLILPVGLLTSCDYLDVIPPEQPIFEDTMRDKSQAVSFLVSTYGGVNNTEPFAYSTYENSTDESVNPESWNGNDQKTAWNIWSATNAGGHWSTLYNYNGHTHMFEKVLAMSNPIGATEADKACWQAEIDFLKAYYHFRLLEMYGPIPLVDTRLEQDTPTEEFPGRSHFDYCVNWIVGKLDKAIDSQALPPQRGADDWGRATSTMALALKGRVLLYAASDLWNGKFPFPDWQNNIYETPGYGKELVSRSYDESKWRRALEANLKALEYAEDEGGRRLIDMDNLPSNLAQVKIPYIPGVNTATEQGKEFAERVLMLRSIVNSSEKTLNKEIIWGTFPQGNNNWIIFAPWPKRVQQYNNQWVDGWCAVNPTLYSIEHFYTANGKLPEKDPQFFTKDQWLQSAGLSGEARDGVIKLNVNREPRFYATFSFDGDDYSPMMCNGEPLTIHLRDANKQGYNPDLFNRDFTVTGYFSKKYTCPELLVSGETGKDNRGNYPKPLIRLAELYLNVAECYAALNDVPNAIKYLNPIRRRAGIPELTENDINSEMSIMDWVRNERFIELWGEGHRFYDVRRWMIAPQQLAANKREGLNVEGAGKNPRFEDLNKRVAVNQPFQWSSKMYLWPVPTNEIYNDPQLIQAPGY